MTDKLEYFEDKHHLRQIEECCGTCRYYKIDQDRDEYCENDEAWNSANDNGYFITAGHICDLFEKKEG